MSSGRGTRARRTRRLSARVALGLASALLGLLALELGARLLGPFGGRADPLVVTAADGTDASAGLRRSDPLLFWSLQPGAEAPSVRINSHGLRGPEIPPDAAGEHRILFLGESTTFAGRMPYEQCYAHRVGELLPRYRGRPVRAINAGVPGYSSFQGFQYLHHRGLALEPDTVVLYFGYNDFLRVSYLSSSQLVDAGRRNDWELFEHRRTPRNRLRAFLERHSDLYRGLRSLVEPDGFERLAHDDTRKFRVPRAHRTALLEGFVELAGEHGFDLVIVVPRYLRFRSHVRLLREFAAARSVPLVDLSTGFPPHPPEAPNELFLDRVHPTPAGHAVIAERIAEVLRRIE